MEAGTSVLFVQHEVEGDAGLHPRDVHRSSEGGVEVGAVEIEASLEDVGGAEIGGVGHFHGQIRLHPETAVAQLRSDTPGDELGPVGHRTDRRIVGVIRRSELECDGSGLNDASIAAEVLRAREGSDPRALVERRNDLKRLVARTARCKDDETGKAESVPHERSFLKWLVGTAGFEPATPCTPSKCASRAALRSGVRYQESAEEVDEARV